MPRPYTLFEVTIRTVQSRFLLRPAPLLNSLILGVLGRALEKHPAIRLFAFKVASDHIHLILAAPDVNSLAAFMNYVDGNIAREAGRLYNWRDKFWSRRYRPIAILDDASLVGRLKYLLAHGCKEGLVASPLDWPGASCERALLFGEKLEGIWYDRTAFYKAERRGQNVRLEDFAVRYEVPLARLPMLEGKSEAEARAFYRNLVSEIEAETRQRCLDSGRELLGVEAVLSADPHSTARAPKRSPAPLCHAAGRRLRQTYRRAYRAFVSLYRRAVERLRDGDPEARFPEGCFLPPLLCPPHLVEAAAPG
ncbi:MAG: transposase [Acidimicrobiia bacterium]|nr:transposase [Acidimicrobiia bacterium]